MKFNKESTENLSENYNIRVTGKTLTAMTGIVLSVLVAALPIAWIRNDNLLLAIHITLIVFVTANLWYIRKSGNLFYASFTIIVPAFSILLYSLFFTGTTDSISWFFLFPVISFFYLGKRMALLTNIILWTFMCAGLYLRIDEYPDGFISLIIHAISYISVTLLCYFFESHRESIQERLLDSSLTDYLTGCGNRRGFEKDLSLELDNYKRYSNSFCLVMMDIDNFKNINDNYGHSVGDVLLKEVSARIKSILRINDSMYRMGGDEFTLLLRNTDIEGGLTLSKRIIEIISQATFHKDIKVTLSAGIDTTEDSPPNPDDIMHDADVALYHAKKHGKNRVERSQPGQKLA